MGPSNDVNDSSGKRKGWDDIEALRLTKKMHMEEDDETSDEDT